MGPFFLRLLKRAVLQHYTVFYEGVSRGRSLAVGTSMELNGTSTALHWPFNGTSTELQWHFNGAIFFLVLADWDIYLWYFINYNKMSKFE